VLWSDLHTARVSHWCCHVHEFNEWIFVKHSDIFGFFLDILVLCCADTTSLPVKMTDWKFSEGFVRLPFVQNGSLLEKRRNPLLQTKRRYSRSGYWRILLHLQNTLTLLQWKINEQQKKAKFWIVEFMNFPSYSAFCANDIDSSSR